MNVKVRSRQLQGKREMNEQEAAEKGNGKGLVTMGVRKGEPLLWYWTRKNKC